MSKDTIYRQDAIDALDGEIKITGRVNAEAVMGYLRLVKDRLERLPTAEPREGKWEIDVDCEYDVFDIAGERTWAIKATCSECEFTMSFIEGHGVFKYCPNCGAQMEEEE